MDARQVSSQTTPGTVFRYLWLFLLLLGVGVVMGVITQTEAVSYFVAVLKFIGALISVIFSILKDSIAQL